MKKCLIMFMLLMLTLIVAAVTQKRQEIRVVDDIAMGEEISEDIAFEQNLPVSDKDTKNK